jgi:hypothetical protein
LDEKRRSAWKAAVSGEARYWAGLSE